jgi:hypothetical protein
MRRSVCVMLAGWCLATWAVGQASQAPPPPPLRQPPQARPPGPPRQPAEAAPLQGEAKLRWVCKQLRLDEQQTPQSEALFAAYQAEMKDMEQHTAELLKGIQDKYAEVQAARTGGDEERAKKLQEELRALAPDMQAESHFFDALESVLNPEQKSRLPAIRKRAEVPGGQSLRPVYVLRAARKLALTPEQDRQLEKALDDYRTSAQSAPPDKGQPPEDRVEQFISNVRAILTPPQAATFDKDVEALRENPPIAQPAQIPDATPPPPPAPPLTPVKPGDEH